MSRSTTEFPERLPVSKVNMRAIKTKAASTGTKIYEVGDELLTRAIDADIAKTKADLRKGPRLGRKIAKPHHHDVKDFEQYLWDEGIIMDTESLAELHPDRLKSVLPMAIADYFSQF